MHLLYLLFIAVFLSNPVQKTNSIVWGSNKRLTWSDFQANAPKLDSHVALSRVEIQYESHVSKGNKMTMDIQSVFIKELSWVKQDRKSDRILRHEQYHFNLTEVWARKLRKEIASRKWNVKSFEKEFNSIFKKHVSQVLKEQSRYDNETNHSQIAEKQAEWEKRIDQELIELKGHTNVTVPFLFE